MHITFFIAKTTINQTGKSLEKDSKYLLLLFNVRKDEHGGKAKTIWIQQSNQITQF